MQCVDNFFEGKVTQSREESEWSPRLPSMDHRNPVRVPFLVERLILLNVPPALPKTPR